MVYHIRYTTSHLQQSCMNELVIPIDHELSIHYLKLIKIVFLPSSIFLGINVIVIQDLRFSQCMLMTEMSWLTKRELDQVTWKTIIFYSNIFYQTFAKKIIFSVDCFFSRYLNWSEISFIFRSVLLLFDKRGKKAHVGFGREFLCKKCNHQLSVQFSYKKNNLIYLNIFMLFSGQHAWHNKLRDKDLFSNDP